MPDTLATLPANCADDAAYSNFDHVLNAEIVRQLEAAPGQLYAEHAAWNFCGYIWQRQDGMWVDQVWRYGAPVQEFLGDKVEAVIEEVLRQYGRE